MYTLIFKKIHTTVFFLLVPFVLFSQQKTGNIVEYFGKEKVEEINEGKVLHVFRNGLALKIQDFTFNSSSFPKDIVFEKFLMRLLPNLKLEVFSCIRSVMFFDR